MFDSADLLRMFYVRLHVELVVAVQLLPREACFGESSRDVWRSVRLRQP